MIDCVAAYRATAFVFSNASTRRPAAYARARSNSSSRGPSARSSDTISRIR